MKISDFIFHHSEGYGPGLRYACRVRAFAPEHGKPIALLTDLHLNIGTSVTNAVERIIRTLIQRGHVTPEYRFIEHYEEGNLPAATFDLVDILPSGLPAWSPLTFDEAIALLGCTREELARPTAHDFRLAAEIGRAKHIMDPHADLPYQPPREVIQRRLAIEAGMISKRQLRQAVDAGHGERVLQALIRQDLSLLGEVYGRPCDEYICFPEFSIGGGRVDFAVFTSRSRMEVILIEIKGADFNFMGASDYKPFNAKINIAAEQIRKRYRRIYEAGLDFRQKFHEIRRSAEAGDYRRRAFLGPEMPLQVDPNKDIVVYGVVIGGRLRDNLSESRKRHDFETGSTPRILVDSWDSWLNRLQRE